MSFIPRPHEIYKHFKGNLYQITAVAQHSETGELLVVYQALCGDFKTYARPLAMFTDRVDREKYPDASQEFRFELQGEDADRRREQQEASAARMPDSSGEKAADASGREETDRLTETDADSSPEPEEWDIDPLVLEFLDSDTYEQKLNILAALHHRITNEMITTMAIASDIEVEDGDVEDRYEGLKNCLLTLQKYECNRLR